MVMIKKITENLLFLTLFVIIFFSLINSKNVKKLPQFDIDLIENLKPIKRYKALSILGDFDKKTDNIENFYCNKVVVSLGHVKANGSFYFDSDNKKVRFLLKTFLGKEFDIGANNDFFWFWSKRMEPNALYYSSKKDAHDTSLRPALSYPWVLETFCFSSLKLNDSIFYSLDNNIFIKTKIIINKKDFFIISVFDLDNQCITGKHLYNDQNLLIASVEYKKYIDHNCEISFPSQFLISWYEEDVFMILDLKNIVFNRNIPTEFWLMPDYEPKINIGN